VRSVVFVSNLKIYVLASYLDEIPRITAKMYIPTDGLSLSYLHIFISSLFLDRGCAESTTQDDGCGRAHV
jgi:hypothetical protein